MVDTTIAREISTCLDVMPVAQQRQVLEFAQTLVKSPCRGVRGETLLKFAGTIDASDLDAISLAIEEDCEGVDADEW